MAELNFAEAGRKYAREALLQPAFLRVHFLRCDTEKSPMPSLLPAKRGKRVGECFQFSSSLY